MLSMPRIVRPDPRRFWRARNLDPPLDRPPADPLSETKNWRNLLTGRRGSQVSHSLPAHLERFIGDEAIPDSRLGLDETWTCRIAFNLLAQVGDINAGILAVLFGFRAPDFAKDVAMRENATRMPNDNRSSAYSVAVVIFPTPSPSRASRCFPGFLIPKLKIHIKHQTSNIKHQRSHR